MTIHKLITQIKDSKAEDWQTLRYILIYLRENNQDDASLTKALIKLENIIRTDEAFRLQLQAKLCLIIEDKDFCDFFIQYSYLEEGGFLNGVWNRIVYKFFHGVYEENDIQYCLQEIFLFNKDIKWIKRLPKGSLLKIIHLLEWNVSEDALKRDLDKAIVALGVKICAFGMARRVKEKYDKLNLDRSVFYELQQNISSSQEESKVLLLLQEIEQTVKELRYRKHEIGTTLLVTYASKKTLLKIRRLKKLLQLKQDFRNEGKWLDILLANLQLQYEKNRIGLFLNRHLDLIALDIVEHTAQKGEKYIAENRGEYYKFFRASMLGGGIIAFFACFKIFLTNLNLQAFSASLLYSLNYAACFVMVKSVGGIIATKQPAMTSSTIVKGIDNNDSLEISSIEEVVALTKQVSASQFISFVGNLAMAFPLAIALNWFITTILGIDFISEYKMNSILNDIRPIEGGAIWYAAIAGVFLSLSGLIAGYFDNKVLANNLPRRIQKNRFLNKTLSKTKINSLANYIKNKLGTLSGNISLGFLLGMSGYLGYVTGLPIDIRHIAFSSANFGFVFDPFQMSYQIIGIGFLGIFMIGLTNFIVSFGLTYFIVLKSRQITFSISTELLKAFFRAFFNDPLSFFYIRKKGKKTQ